MNNDMIEFTNLQPVTKSLKFKLNPVGNTEKNLQKDGIIAAAKLKDEKKDKLKELINEYHRYFISKMLISDNMREIFNETALNEAYNVFLEGDKEKLAKHLNELEKGMHNIFKADEVYKSMDKKEFINVYMMDYFKDDKAALDILAFFQKDTSSVKSFNEIRKRQYEVNDNGKKAVTITKRCVQDNLITYFKNIEAWNALQKKVNDGSLLGTDFNVEINALTSYMKYDKRVDFTLTGYADYISQQGIDIYNTIIGGVSLEDGSMIKGLNTIVNAHNQKCTSSDEKLPLFRALYKQIMTKSNSFSFLEDGLKSDEQVHDLVHSYADTIKGLIPEVTELFNGIEKYDLGNIYISKNAFGSISNEVFGKYNIIEDAIIRNYNETHPAKDQETKTFLDNRKKYLNSIDTYSVKELSDYTDTDILSFLKEFEDLVYDFMSCYKGFNNFKFEKADFKKDRNAKAVVRGLLDSIVAIDKFIKRFNPSSMPISADPSFYSELNRILDTINEYRGVYNKVRSYAQKKDFKNIEIPVNFNRNEQFLDGWTDEKVGGGIILIKDGKYYLGIISAGDKKCIGSAPESHSEDCYDLMNYNMLTAPNKSLPQMFMCKGFIEENEALTADYSEIINKYRARKEGNYQYTVEDEYKLIAYYITCLKRSGKAELFTMEFKKPEEYGEKNPFYNFCEDISKYIYSISFNKIDVSYINSLVDKGSLYLFQIYNKDFSKGTKGKKDLYTLYWMMTFDERNIKEKIYKLNGGATVQFREKSLSNPFIHKAGTPIQNKNARNDIKTVIYNYDIIKDKRYLYDQFTLTVSVTINNLAPSLKRYNSVFNSIVNEHIRENSDNIHVIGISRGIKNLIYYTVTDLKGNIVEHDSFNVIKNESIREGKHYVTEVDYNNMLEKREAENDKKQLEWDSEYTIKDLKMGYISRIIPEIARLVLKYNAILCLEDLSGDFKDKQKAIEKTIYTEFENALMSKFNCLVVNKDISSSEPGSVMRPLQLAPTVSTKDDMRFQQGMIFFINPAYTSNLDPSTGFINRLDTRYKGKEHAKNFISSLDFITYENHIYRIGFDYKNFNRITDNTKTDWIINTAGKRKWLRKNKDTNNNWKGSVIDLTSEYDKLFAEYNIDRNADIKEQIINIHKAELYDRFLNLLRITLQTNNDIDGEYIYISPVEGSIYNTRQINADCIGAYNIARKGIMAVNKILESEDGFVKTSSSGEDWISYAQTHLQK